MLRVGGEDRDLASRPHIEIRDSAAAADQHLDRPSGGLYPRQMLNAILFQNEVEPFAVR